MYAISGGQQAGSAWVGAVVSASLWSGTAASWVDLSMFLPAEFSSSQATGISSDGVNVYVTGYGLNWITGRTEALLWTRAIPGPAACNLADLTGIGGPPAIPDGLLTGDDFNAFISAFAAGENLADLTGIGGPPSEPDGLITGDDFNAFIAAFAAGCP